MLWIFIEQQKQYANVCEAIKYWHKKHFSLLSQQLTFIERGAHAGASRATNFKDCRNKKLVPVRPSIFLNKGNNTIDYN